MPVRMRHAWVVAVAALALGRGLAAQGASPPVQDSAAAGPRPIPGDSIPELGRTAALFLGGLRPQLPSDSAIARLDSTLADIAARYDAQVPRVTPDWLGTMFYEELVDLEAMLGQLARRLERWSGDAEGLARRIAQPLDSLEAIRERWQMTRAEAWAALPAALRDQVSGMLRLTDSIGGEMRPVLDRVLAMQTRGSALAIALGASREEVRAAQDRVRRQVLRRDSRPIWDAFGRQDRVTAADSLAIEAPVDRVGITLRYLAQHTGRVQLQIALFVVAALVFWRVGRRRERWVTAEFAMHWPSDLLAHPIAAGAVLALLFTRLIHPGAPQSVFGLGFLLVLPCLVVLLRPLLEPRYRAPAYLLVALWALRVLASTLSWPVAVARIMLLALAGAGAGALVWLARSTRRASGARHAAGGLAQAGAGLLVVGLVANLFGFVVLTDLIVSATLTVALTSLALIALADVVVGAVLVGLLATPAGRLRVIRLNRDAVVRRVRGLVRLAALVFWLSVVLRQFRLLDTVLGALAGFLRASVTLGSWEFSVGEILVFLATLAVAVYVARGLRAVLRHDVLSGMDRGVPEAASSLVYYLTLAIGMLFAAGAAGLDLGRLTIIAGALGVGIGFGLQSIVANFIAGLILLFERPIKPGDTLELEGLRGVVQQIGIRASTLRTFQGADVIVPNQDFIVGRVVNWTLSDQTRRVEIPIGVAYGSDPDQVIALVREAAVAHPKVLPRPAVEVLMTGFGESSLDFELRLWTSTDDWLAVRSDILVAVYRHFAERGIEIPFPQRDLHIRSGLPEAGSPPAAP